jgi:DNA repair protein RecO (recombination protein O)
LNRITGVQPIESFKKIRADLGKSFLAGAMVSFVGRLLRENEREIKVFNLLRDWLEYLNNSNIPYRLLLVGFAVKLLAALGFTPVLDRCVICGKNFSNSALNKRIFFSLSAGGIICSVCAPNKSLPEEKFLVLSNIDIKDWQELLNKEWNQIPSAISNKLNKTIYEFAEYHSEKKIDRGMF